ncbi:hypothetical protein JOC95_003293 [Bacillus tianshenii]|uniref:Uncharacterized protein n=1 Tax=Sutcliffiella tianshenii TaxID=1463404 RepID=A0ABS2P3B0_9BACI|nr:hypothetical protein [Bacillus tianshenii]
MKPSNLLKGKWASAKKHFANFFGQENCRLRKGAKPEQGIDLDR